MSETTPDTHGCYVTFMPIKSNKLSIAGTKKKKKKQHVPFFLARLGIEELEHLRMR